MATYIPGVTDYIPKLQPFQPDLNFYNTVLQTKEAQYMAAYDKISRVYGTLLNSQMLREPDIKKRDQFFKDIHQEIQRMSMVDLSMPQNETSALKVFQPILDDKNIVSDIAYTKQWNNERSKAQSLRDCVGKDPKDCKGYWQEGYDNLNYWAEDYKRTTDEEALKYDWTPRYVPKVDVGGLFQGMMKDMKFKVVDTGFTKDNRFMIEQTNGDALTVPLYNYLYGTLGQDAGVSDMYRVLAQNSRHRWVNENVGNYNGDYGAAEDAYNIKIQGMVNNVVEDKKNLDKTKANIGAKINVVKSQIDNSPTPISEESPIYKALKVLLQEDEVVNQATGKVDDIIQGIERTGIFTSDRMAKRQFYDNLVSHDALKLDMLNLAKSYAQGTSQTKFKPNPYQVNAEKFYQQMKLADFKNKLGIERDILKAQMKRSLELEKLKLKGGKDIPSSIPNTYSPDLGMDALKGSSTPEMDVLKVERDAKARMAVAADSNRALAVKKFYLDLASAADNETDENKRAYAISQLNQIFGSEKGSDGTYVTRQLKKPEDYYGLVKSLSKDSVFTSTFPEIPTNISGYVSNVELESQAYNAYMKTTRDNIKNLFSYLDSKAGTIKDASKDDLIKLKAVVNEDTGYGRTPADVQQRLAKSGIVVDLDEAAEIQAEYLDIFHKHYSQGYTVGSSQDPVVKPYSWKPGQAVNTGGKAAYPTTAIVGSSYSSLNQATVDALTMNDWMQKNKDPMSYMIYKGTGITKDQKDEGISPTENSAEKNFIEYALNTLRTEVPSKPEKTRVSEGMRVTVHPITMNDPNMVGFGISIPETLFNQWKKAQGKTAVGTYDDYANFTIAMPADKAPKDIYDRFDPKPVKAILQSGGVVNISVPDAGEVKLYPNADGTVGISGVLYHVPKEGGKQLVATRIDPLGWNPNVDPDYLYNRLSEELRIAARKNNEGLRSPYNPVNIGQISNSEQAEQMIRAQQLVNQQ